MFLVSRSFTSRRGVLGRLAEHFEFELLWLAGWPGWLAGNQQPADHGSRKLQSTSVHLLNAQHGELDFDHPIHIVPGIHQAPYRFAWGPP